MLGFSQSQLTYPLRLHVHYFLLMSSYSPSLVPIEIFEPLKNCSLIILVFPEGWSSITLIAVSLPVQTVKPSDSILRMVPGSSRLGPVTFSARQIFKTCPFMVVNATG